MSFTLALLSSPVAQLAISLFILTLSIHLLFLKRHQSTLTTPISINYHFTRKCNKTCKFCFHTEKSSHVASEAEMMRGLRLLKEARMRKINFAGGEPFLYPKKLGWLCRYCKEVLGLESVSIITNGTEVTEKWLGVYGGFVDVMGVSCDSFDERTGKDRVPGQRHCCEKYADFLIAVRSDVTAFLEIYLRSSFADLLFQNELIGRGTGENVKQLFRIRDWCRALGIKFKLNTVVCDLNWQEDMSSTIQDLQPFRWKVFQVLFVEDENDGGTSDTVLDERKRDARALLISNEQFEVFCGKHRHLDAFVPEPNDLMASSYLILDEFLCFLDKGSGKERQSRSILDVGVAEALEEINFDKEAFVKRGGLYAWSKEVDDEACGSAKAKELEW
jgi:radical S-adenosyl methionine domain-containing protein 2